MVEQKFLMLKTLISVKLLYVLIKVLFQHEFPFSEWPTLSPYGWQTIYINLHWFKKTVFFTTFGFFTPFFHGDPPKVRCQKMLPVSAAAQSEVGGSKSERGCFMGRTGKSSILTGDVELPGDEIPVKIDDWWPVKWDFITLSLSLGTVNLLNYRR